MVPADDEVTSQSAIGGNAYHSPAAFTTTHWSVVLEAQGESPAAQEALEKLCRIYWRPIYSFVRRQGAGPEEAQDLTQGFFALLLERRDLRTVRKEKGRLRSYLLTALKHFLADERRRAMAIKRGKGERLIPLEELRTEERSGMEPADPLTAERIYERRWASTLLDRVLSRLEDKYRTRGNAALFDSLQSIAGRRAGGAVAGGYCGATWDDRKRRFAGLSSISAKLSIVIARGNCSYRCDSRRYRKRVALSDCCDSRIRPDRILRSTRWGRTPSLGQ